MSGFSEMYNHPVFQTTAKHNMAFARIFLACVIIACLGCSGYNPFTDESNARGVMKTDLHSGDTLQIFETRPIKIMFLVRNLLASCSLYTESNRFFKDTCIDFNSFDSFECNVSFYDTGQHRIRLVTVRESGEIIEQNILIHAVNPLYQPEIKAQVGDSVRLKGVGVKDRDVLYSWKFADGEELLCYSSDTLHKIRGTSGPECRFSVSDRKRSYRSPPVKFTCIVEDTTAPVITCMNERQGDTLIAHDSGFYFMIRVKDKGGAVRAAMNNLAADKVFYYNDHNDYLWFIKGVDALNEPMPLDVFAEDAFLNRSNKRYWLRYDSSGQRSGLVYLRIISPASPVIKRRQFYLSGEVVNFLNSQSGTLDLTVDGIAYGAWDFRDKISGRWNFSISMGEGKNSCNLKFGLTNIKGEMLIDTGFQVLYDPSGADTRKPNLIELAVDGRPVYEWGEWIVVDRSPVSMKVIAFDDGGGIRRVSVNDDIIGKPDSVDFIWEKELVPSADGAAFTVRITDMANNDTSMFFTLKLNHRPEIEYYPEPVGAVVGKEYSDFIEASDQDGDRVIYKVTEGPASFTVDSLSGKIVWIPAMADTAVSRVLISYNDKYWKDMICTLNVTVAPVIIKKPQNILLSYSGETIDDSELVYDLSDPSLSATLTVFVSDPDLMIESNDSIMFWYSGVTEKTEWNGNPVSVTLNAMEKETGYDTLFVYIAYGKNVYIDTRILYYGSAPGKPAFISPSDGQIVSNECEFIWTAVVDADTLNKISYSLYLAHGKDNFTLAVNGLTGTKHTVRLEKSGMYRCKVAAFDGKCLSESEAITVNVAQ